MEKSNQFISVMNAVFRSAEFSVVENLHSSGGGSQGGGSQKPSSGEQSGGGPSGIQDKDPFSPSKTSIVYAEPRPSVDESEYMNDLVDNFIGNNGIPLTESNVKAIKGESLSIASGYASMVKALMAMYGDKVFEKNYSYSDITFKISQESDVCTIQGILNRNGAFSSGVIMNFVDKGGEYLFGFAKYGFNGMVGQEISEIEFSYYNSNVGAMHVSMWGKGKEILTDYQFASNAFSIDEIMACSFDAENYVAKDIDSCTEEQVKCVLDFGLDVLQFNNSTVKGIMEIKSSATIKESELNEMNSLIEENYYVNPYYYQTNDTFVRDSYTVPENVTVIEKCSIPATKVLYIHKNVTKIESMPFEKPQYLEEIIFEDAENGKLTQIGSFDQTKNGRPTFILSMTKVKNFTLPKTVKKLELGDYVVNTVVEKLDLSTYNPSWISDKSQFTYNFKEDGFYNGMENYYKDEYRNKAYVTLNICGGSQVPYKEVRYINELYMPQFNMGIEFDSWYEIQLGENGNTVYAFDFITKVLQATEMPFSEWIAEQNYTLTYDIIGKLYINDINTIVSEEFLYGDFEKGTSSPNSDKDKEKEKDKENLNSKGEEYGRKDFEIVLYDNKFHSDFSHEGDKAQTMGGANYYSTIKEIIVSNANYQSILDAEEEIFDDEVGSIEELINGRVKVTKK